MDPDFFRDLIAEIIRGAIEDPMGTFTPVREIERGVEDLLSGDEMAALDLLLAASGGVRNRPTAPRASTSSARSSRVVGGRGGGEGISDEESLENLFKTIRESMARNANDDPIDAAFREIELERMFQESLELEDIPLLETEDFQQLLRKAGITELLGALWSMGQMVHRTKQESDAQLFRQAALDSDLAAQVISNVFAREGGEVPSDQQIEDAQRLIMTILSPVR